MRKIYFSLTAILLVVGAVAGASYAVFSNSVTSGLNAFATGNADLKIKIDTNKDGTATSNWQDEVTPYDQHVKDNWQNLYPGWEDTYWVYLKNDSSSPIKLKIVPEIKNNDWNNLLDNIYMSFSWLNGSNDTGSKTLREWINADDNPELVPVLDQGEDAGPWVVKFYIPETAGNNIAEKTINFDLVFNGIQVTD